MVIYQLINIWNAVVSEDNASNFFEHCVVTIVGKTLRAKGMEGIYVTMDMES